MAARPASSRRVRLLDDHHAGGVDGPCEVEGGLQPGQVRLPARLHLVGVPVPVVEDTDGVHGDEDHAALHPTGVLGVGLARRSLAGQRDAVLTEGVRVGIEDGPEVGQPPGRVSRAVAPLVVARRVDERRGRGVEQVPSLGVVDVEARCLGRGLVADVAVVDDEGQRPRVHVGHRPGELLLLDFEVPRVTHQPDLEGGGRRRPGRDRRRRGRGRRGRGGGRLSGRRGGRRRRNGFVAPGGGGRRRWNGRDPGDGPAERLADGRAGVGRRHRR